MNYKRSSRAFALKVAAMSCGVVFSSSSLEIRAQSLNPPQNPAVDENSVNIPNGDIQLSQRDISIGPDDKFGIYYERYLSGGQWRDNFLNEIVTEQFFSGDVFTYAKFGNYYEPFSLGGPMSATGSFSTRTFVQLKDGTYISYNDLFYSFGPDSTGYGKDWNISDYRQSKNGVRWSIHHKKATIGGIPVFRIQSVTTNTGYQLKINYKTSATTNILDWRTIVSVTAINNAYEYCDPSADSCSLTGPWKSSNYPAGFLPDALSTYDAVDASGNTTKYVFDGTNIKIRTSDSSYDNIVYAYPYVGNICGSSRYCPTNNGRMVSSVNINGKSITYSYVYNSSTDKITLSKTGSLSLSDTYVIDPAFGGISSYRNSLLKTKSYTYNSGIITKETFPEGNYVSIVPDMSGNPTQTIARAKSGSGLADLTEARSFGPCAQPTSVTDARSNVTTYTYSTAHCGVLTETGPSVGGIAPVKRYAYAERYAWIKNSAGSYVQAATPVWLKTEERTCRTTATVSGACAGGSADEVVTAYDYGPNSGPNNLLLRGIAVTSGGATLRTCYSYDVYGNKISETKPRAGLTSCP